MSFPDALLLAYVTGTVVAFFMLRLDPQDDDGVEIDLWEDFDRALLWPLYLRRPW